MILFIGMGQTGYDLAQFYLNHRLHHSNSTEPLYFFDTRENPPFEKKIKSLIDYFLPSKNCCYQKIKPSQFNDQLINDADEIYLSTAIEPSKIKGFFQSSDTFNQLLKKCQTDLDLFCHQLKNNQGNPQEKTKLIAITGTNGKSSICQFLLELCQSAGLSAEILGNFGGGFLQTFNPQAKAAKTKRDVYILELSSFQLYYSKVMQFDVAIFSNLCFEHLDWHGSFEAYAQAKLKIFEHSEAKIYWQSDEINHLITHSNNESNQNCIAIDSHYFSQFNGIELFTQLNETDQINFSLAFKGFQYFQAFQDIQTFQSLAIQPLNETNHSNHLNQSNHSALIEQTLAHHQALKYRNQKMLIDGVEWINDSKSTNTHSLIAALSNLSHSFQSPHSSHSVNNDRVNLFLIIGGEIKDLKGGDFKKLADWLKSSYPNKSISIKNIFIYGGASDLIKKDLAINSDSNQATQYQAIQSQTIQSVTNLADAVLAAFKASNQFKQKYPHSIIQVLFSPGCSSLSTFKNYAHRGEVFNQLVAQCHHQFQLNQSDYCVKNNESN